MKKSAIILCMLFFFLGFIGRAHSLNVTYFGEDAGLGDDKGKLSDHPDADAARDAFLANLIGVGTESFESILMNTPEDPLTTPNLDFGAAGTATLTGNGEVMNDAFGPSTSIPPNDPQTDNEWFGRFAISGNQYFGQVKAPGFSIDFSDPVAAFGFYAVDIGDFLGTLTLTFLNGETKLISYPSDFTTGGSVSYFGYINTENLFKTVVFNTTSGADDVFGFDDLTIGSVDQVNPNPSPNPVPEPTTMLLLCTGLAGLAGLRKVKIRK